MAVRLLAGPFDIVSGDGYALTGEYDNVYGNVWFPGVGLLARVGTLPWALNSIITLDGVYQGIAGNQGHWLCWWAGSHKVMYRKEGKEYVCDPKVLIPVGKAQLDEVPVGYYQYVRLEDRVVWFTSYHIHASVDGVGCEEGEQFSFGGGYVWAGRDSTDIFVADSSGDNCCFYNTRTKTVSSPVMHIGMHNDGLYYAPEFGVLVSLHQNPPQLRVWSLEVKPAVLSDVEVISGEVVGGRLATYRVQALGDMADPCVGELIDWKLSGAGILLNVQSTTDEEGYAITRVKYGLSESGLSTVTASLLC